MNAELSSRVPVIRDYIVFRFTDDGAVLVTPQDGDVRVLNALGAAVWKLIDGQHTVADIARKLAKSYEAPLERVQEDVVTFFGELEARRLLRWKDDAEAWHEG